MVSRAPGAPTPAIVALIPARAGSKRVPGKNIRALAGHPLIAYTIAAARQSGIFSRIVVSTDDETIAAIARHYGAEVPFLRPAEFASDVSPDIEWLRYTLRRFHDEGYTPAAFALLRPTSPFRPAAVIEQAWRLFQAEVGADSLRAVEPCAQHPAKMWVVRGRRMLPLLPFGSDKAPWHSMQYASLPRVYVQNASLEIAWCRVVLDGDSIAGETVVPFISEGYDGFDINGPLEWQLAEQLVSSGAAVLPTIEQSTWGD